MKNKITDIAWYAGIWIAIIVILAIINFGPWPLLVLFAGGAITEHAYHVFRN